MNVSPANRWLLCRPQGGLNDILSEIGKCVAYGQRFDRLVIVETDYHSFDHFNDEFSHYFVSSSPALILSSKGFKEKFNSLDCMPTEILNRVNEYRDLPGKIGMDEKTGAVISFNFQCDYDSPLLVHHSVGSRKGLNALIALRHLQLAPYLVERLQERLKILGQNYVALHVRHTDYKTNYEARIKALRHKISEPLFVATDNRAVLHYCQAAFGSDQVFSFAALPDQSGETLHYNQSPTSARPRNEDAILDVFTLALAKNYYFFSRQTGGFSVRPSYSGFSLLADRLRARPDLLVQILGTQFQHLTPESGSFFQLRRFLRDF